MNGMAGISNLYPTVTHRNMPIYQTERMGLLHHKRRALLDAVGLINAEIDRLTVMEQHKAFAHFKRQLVLGVESRLCCQLNIDGQF